MRNIVFVIFSFFCAAATAQCNLLSELQSEGFENLLLIENNEELELHYENRRYRFEGKAVRRVFELIVKSDCANENITLIIYNKGLPITEITTKKSLIKRLITGNISAKVFNSQSHFGFTDRKKPKHKETQSSFLKSDLAVAARTDYMLGNFDNPIRWTPTLLPSIQTTLAKGTQINATYSVVLFDDLYYWEKSRWRYAFASHNGRLPGTIFTRLSAGFFELTQFGIESQVTKFFLEDKFRLDLNLSLTENRFLDTPPGRKAIDKNHLSYGVKATYRYTPWTTDLSVHYGRYIFDDTGYTVLLQRQFNEVYIGFFMREVDRQIVGSFGKLYDKNYGFQFTVPIGTKKHLKPSYLRAKTDEQFFLDYNYTGGVDIGARIYAPGTVIHELEEYYPSTLKKALENYTKTGK
ncbi:MAG: YjbH domain-containing protein [Flavobacteriaceae bacterium]